MFTFLTVVLLSGLSAAPSTNVSFVTGGMISDMPDHYGSLFRVDLDSLECTAIFKGTHPLFLLDVADTADRALVRYFEKGVGYTVVMLGSDGTVLATIGDSGSAVFVKPDGSCVAYSRDPYSHGDPVVSEGIWVHDYDDNSEKKLCDGGGWLEWVEFNGRLYIRGGEVSKRCFIYDSKTESVYESKIGYGEFSPGGAFLWQYELGGGTQIVQNDSQDVISEEYEILKSRRHGTPPRWLNASIITLPHFVDEFEDYLLFVETGKTLRAPGRVIAVASDEQSVYVCKPGLVVEKVSMESLTVIDEGKDKGTDK